MGEDHGEDALLAACYGNSLKLATKHGIRTPVFPAITTGAYGFHPGVCHGREVNDYYVTVLGQWDG